MPIDIRNSDGLSEFTTKIKSWKPVVHVIYAVLL